MERCILLSARRYDFKDDSGKQVEGVNLTYITGAQETEGDTRGCQPINITGAAAMWSSLAVVPGVYDFDFKQRPGPKGKPTLTLVGMKYQGPLDLGAFALPDV